MSERKVSSLADFKELAQAVFENDSERMAFYGKRGQCQVKAYLIESNLATERIPALLGEWRPLKEEGWHTNLDADPLKNETLFLRARGRVWSLFSLLDATSSDYAVENWISGSHDLDNCWLGRGMLKYWQREENWTEKGIGIKFEDSLSPEDRRGHFSLKAWHGAQGLAEPLRMALEYASKSYTIHSIRYEKGGLAGSSMISEWYNNGKVTVNRCSDANEMLASVFKMAILYDDRLKEATGLRDTSFAPFEIDFKGQKADLDLFTDAVSKARGAMKLWLVETEREEAFRRYSGVDIHTWDRILMVMGDSYSYLTIPGKGCVNAAPRLATIQGEEIGGQATITCDGVDVFA
jgi:hypothetical protein